MVIGVVGRIEDLVEPFAGHPVGDVINPLSPLVLDHVALVVELGLVEGTQEEAHPVGFEPEGGLEAVGRQGLVIIGPVGAGAAVDLGAELLERSEVFGVVIL